MGLGARNAPAQPSNPQPYGCWEIDVRLFDKRMIEIDAFTCRQDTFAGPDDFFVRLTREDNGAMYEDRGTRRDHNLFEGTSGFGGRFSVHILENGGFFSQGVGGDIDFIMVAALTGPDHARCFRKFEVRKPTVLWGKSVDVGTYFATTEDQLVKTAPKAPAELTRPLPAS